MVETDSHKNKTFVTHLIRIKNSKLKTVLEKDFLLNILTINELITFPGVINNFFLYSCTNCNQYNCVIKTTIVIILYIIFIYLLIVYLHGTKVIRIQYRLNTC